MASTVKPARVSDAGYRASVPQEQIDAHAAKATQLQQQLAAARTDEERARARGAEELAREVEAGGRALQERVEVAERLVAEAEGHTRAAEQEGERALVSHPLLPPLVPSQRACSRKKTRVARTLHSKPWTLNHGRWTQQAVQAGKMKEAEEYQQHLEREMAEAQVLPPIQPSFLLQRLPRWLETTTPPEECTLGTSLIGGRPSSTLREMAEA